MTRLGFLGTGQLARFFVAGLARYPGRYRISLSPRNAANAAELAARHGAEVAPDNQALIDRSDLIVVAVLPQQARAALAPLKFRADQTALSVMAGIGLGEFRKQVSPAAAAVAMMPGLANAHNIGPSVLYPPLPAAVALLELLGPVHGYEDESSYASASTMGAFSGMSIRWMAELIGWYRAQGLTSADARKLVAETLAGNARTLLETPLSLEEIQAGVATPGGITEQGCRLLAEGKSWSEALDAVRARMKG